ncbi:MAG: DUF1189 domain-containing protein [Rickettsia endosymbiont of Bryobia graminum]|nr:DUF1189 domain-containing protein [Rickettsia endosymbiont of Bryobia graminum]
MTTKLLLWIRALFNQLWLSVSSINFYQNVYLSYKGYGVRYLFTIVFLSSLIYSLSIFNYLLTLKSYFNSSNSSTNSTTIDYILKQLPEIHYDGKQIAVDQEEPIYLLDENNNKIAVVDTKNQLSAIDKKRIPILFSSDYVSFATVEITDKKKDNFIVKYSQLFGSVSEELTQETIKKYFIQILNQAPRVFIYILMPLLIILRFCSILFEKFFIVLIVYLLTNFFGLKSSVQTCCRIVLFTSGIPILLQPLIIIFLPEFNSLIFFIQIISYLLLFLAIIQIRKGILIRGNR